MLSSVGEYAAVGPRVQDAEHHAQANPDEAGEGRSSRRPQSITGNDGALAVRRTTGKRSDPFCSNAITAVTEVHMAKL